MNIEELRSQQCLPRKGAEHALNNARCDSLLPSLPGWSLESDHSGISKQFHFKNFHETMAFMNAIAWVAHQQDHHPDVKLGYNYCFVRYSTHDVGGLSLNDFICAAKVEALFSP